MTAFRREILDRVATTRGTLAAAREHGDDYLAEVTLGELESLLRLAGDHGVEVPPGLSGAL